MADGSGFDWADKIAKLLRKAEGRTTPEERDSLISKAQALMTQYSITEEMLHSHGDVEREQIIEEVIEYTGVFQDTMMGIGFAILMHNSCRGFYSKREYAKPTAHLLTVAGFESDVRRVRYLDTSLQVQCASGLADWQKEHAEELAAMSASHKYRTRREFVLGFVAGLEMKLAEGQREGVREAAAARVASANVTAEVASKEVALALRSRADTVKDWFDEKHGGSLRRGRARNYGRYGAGARGAGVAAGRSADLGGGTSLKGGDRKKLN